MSRAWNYIVETSAKFAGKKGVVALREKLNSFHDKVTKRFDVNYLNSQYNRYQNWKHRQGTELAKKANMFLDEHGGGQRRGDFARTYIIDYIGYFDTKNAPYFDMGGEGLAVIQIIRERVYARKAKQKPSYKTEYFLVGKNEAGTYFSHALSSRENYKTVNDALRWIWNGEEVLERQGDIAIVKSDKQKNRLPKLPSGHQLIDGEIVHTTHPTIKAPSDFEKLIVAKRATVRIISESRD